jgi:hypothetical protein
MCLKKLFFRYYNINDHLAPPSTETDYDHIPCAELLRDTKIEWKTAAAQAQAMSAVSSTDIMNVNTDGSPLTHASAIGGENQAEWRLADGIEHRKLVTQTLTMHIIHKAHIPKERAKDVAYYNPQVKEKFKEGK